jgi:hypothetical protein
VSPWTIFRWIRKKHHGVPMKVLRNRYGWSKPGRKSLKWQDGNVRLFELTSVHVGPFMARHYRARPHPYSASTSMESPMHSERCTSGSGEGARKPAGD